MANNFIYVKNFWELLGKHMQIILYRKTGSLLFGIPDSEAN